MSTFTSEPGVRLGGRYRLEDRLAAAGGWSAWKAIDEILARPVSVITFASGFPRLEQAVTAARAASRLTDTRLTQVFDVEDSWEHAYIVLEWPVGDTLTDLVAAGSVEPEAGARIVAETAAALSGAHAAGLAHLCLRPDTVRWTPGGGVKVTGLGIDAALSGVTADDPELADTRGLGQLLYTALTGLWPGPDYPELPPAPESDGQPRRPRQVRAGVPTALDEVAARALALPGRDGEAAYTAPAEVATALTAAIPPVAVPPAAVRRDGRRDGAYWLAEQRGDHHGTQTRSVPGDKRTQPSPGSDEPFRPGRRGAGRAIAVSLLLALVVAGASAAALHLLNKPPSHSSSTPPRKSSGPPTSSPTQGPIITPLSAAGFDALNPGDRGDENTNQAENVLDGNSAGWSTQWYGTANFGNLKAGTGFILSLPSGAKVSSLTVTFGSEPGADVSILEGDSPARSKANLHSMTPVASDSNASGATKFTVAHPVTAKYLVIWFTKLPPLAGSPGRYEAQIFSVVIHGTS
ncbi:MAG TPA: protein kinase family protein [Streptosporangiaceae bacterium]|nr:protein kinase family protein [Streptosporangiaceae bacterium]